MNPQVAIIGFKSDEGVRRNNGRPGAAEGPDEIRAHHTRMASHLDPERVSVADLGDVTVMNGDLEAAQAVFRGWSPMSTSINRPIPSVWGRA